MNNGTMNQHSSPTYAQVMAFIQQPSFYRLDGVSTQDGVKQSGNLLDGMDYRGVVLAAEFVADLRNEALVSSLHRYIAIWRESPGF